MIKSRYFMTRRSCSGLGPKSRIARVLASKPCQRLGIYEGDSGFLLGECECYRDVVFGGVRLENCVEVKDRFLNGVGDSAR